MRTNLIYDLPTRLFHWIFAGLFVAIYSVAQLADSESSLFSFHMLGGFLLTFIVVLRIIWGLIGTKYARFSSFQLHPMKLIGYAMGVVLGNKKIWSGHNPASSWAAVIMFALTLGLGATGYLMGQGDTETYEDLHELFANSFVLVAVLHVTGVLLHIIRHGDNLGLSMIDGRKNNVAQTDTIHSAKTSVAVLFLGLATAFAVHLVQHYDGASRTLNLFGTTLQLGELEENEHESDDED